MFKSKTLILCFILASLACGFAWLFFLPSLKNVSEYEQLLQISDSSKKETEPAAYLSKQMRKGISKQIFFNKGNDTLQIKLKSENSELFLEFYHGKAEIVEKFDSARFFMQEELYYLLPDGRKAIRQSNDRLMYEGKDPALSDSWVLDEASAVPMQTIRFLEARFAKYAYQRSHLVAEDVKIARYCLPGHQLSESQNGAKMIMSGVADTVEFSLNETDFRINAKKFKATMPDLETSW